MTEIPETRYARSGDAHVAYQVLGDGPIDLLVGLGLPLSIDTLWDAPQPGRFLRRLATFSRVIRCAQAIVESVRVLGIDVRCGVHTGEIERREKDIGGIAVHIAARIKEQAGGGEVLVSRTVTDLVVGSGLEFESFGEHELKGVPGQWQLYAVKP